MRAGRPFRLAEEGDAADARARLNAMVVFRSRQFAYENTVAWWTAVATAAMLVAAFTIADAWSHAPWAIYGALALLGLVLTLPQTITVDDTHVRVRLAGALRRDIALADVSAVERRGYRPLREFGG